MPHLDVYSREGCHQCDVLIKELQVLLQGRVNIEIHDVDTREEWWRSYDERVPVVELAGVVLCEFSLDRRRILDALSDLAIEE